MKIELRAFIHEENNKMKEKRFDRLEDLTEKRNCKISSSKERPDRLLFLTHVSSSSLSNNEIIESNVLMKMWQMFGPRVIHRVLWLLGFT